MHETDRILAQGVGGRGHASVCKHSVFVCECWGGRAEASRSWFTPAAVIRTYLAYCMTDTNSTAASASDV